MTKCRMVELWANEGETEFGIRVAGEPGFKAITTSHPNMMFEKIIDSATMLEDFPYNWPFTLDLWVMERFSRRVSSRTASEAARTHTAELLQ
ncbi:MAG: hypothetical protein QXJ74_09225 [Nitrososphaera sp.]|uniref:hypothetical protein n=1 Tax=Nitrososphaera sp. TaxID=1971748 RepID=UPI0018355C8E|nr:hypothetical protein [Nitrososphaera sp.]NWG36726.1 hypothetical protein [Nitrososphaera sp.]